MENSCESIVVGTRQDVSQSQDGENDVAAPGLPAWFVTSVA